MAHVFLISMQPTAPPFLRDEVAALLSSPAQKGGHTAPTHPNQETPTATAPQHRGPTAPPQPEQDAHCPPATIIVLVLNV